MASNGAKLGAFQNDIFAQGLDLRRSVVPHALGTFVADDAATFSQGMMVSLNSSGKVVLADGADVLGVAKWSKHSLGNSLKVDEPMTVAFGSTVNLARANVSNLTVRSAVDQGGVVVAAASNYTLNATNGTLAWANPTAGTNAPANGAVVYVSYTFAMTEADYRFQGKNFFNSNDIVSNNDNHIAVIQSPATLFTTMYDTSRTYALTGTSSNLYIGGATSGLEGLFTNNASEGAYVGRVIQLPSASDPFMGVRFINQPEEA